MQAIWFGRSCDKALGQTLPAGNNETEFREALPKELPSAATLFKASSSQSHKNTLVFRKKEKTESVDGTGVQETAHWALVWVNY